MFFSSAGILLHAIESVRSQTYKAVQIIVVNDGSTQSEYYSHNFGDDITVIHLSKNTRDIFGTKILGIQRNIGSTIATGKYLAFLDDDDVWLPNKLMLQVEAMENTGNKMACTEGLFGHGVYDILKKYPKYHSEHYYKALKHIFRNTSIMDNGLPAIFDKTLLTIHNCCIASSVIIDRSLFIKIGMFNKMPNAEDYDCWLRAIEHTNCCHILEPCVYYDGGHGDGQLYL